MSSTRFLPSSHASASPMGGAFQTAIQEYVKKIPVDDRAAFLSASNIIDRLQQMQDDRKPLISNSLTTRVEKVLQCVNKFMSSLAIFIQQHPDISSLVVGGINCVLTVGTPVCTSNE